MHLLNFLNVTQYQCINGKQECSTKSSIVRLVSLSTEKIKKNNDNFSVTSEFYILECYTENRCAKPCSRYSDGFHSVIVRTR